MAEITVKAALDHSPRKQFLKDFNLAFARGNADFIIEHVSDDIHWIIYGDKEIQGKEAFTKEVNIMKDYTADELVIRSIVTHGREAALNGEIKMGGKVYAFCDVYQFNHSTNNLISRMESYVIPIEK